MNTTTISLSSAAVLALIIVSAIPMFANAAPPEKTEGFVCPVLSEKVGENNPNAIEIADGDYSLIPSGSPKTISIPTIATNDDGDGAPDGPHASPGDRTYTAIWSSN